MRCCGQDCYAGMASGSVPPHDVLLTNPPYSGDHMERLLRFCVASGKPWVLLLPNFVVTKVWEHCWRAPGPSHAVAWCAQAWYKALSRTLVQPPIYLCPRQRYNYLPPEGFRQQMHHAAALVTVAQPSLWQARKEDCAF